VWRFLLAFLVGVLLAVGAVLAFAQQQQTLRWERRMDLLAETSRRIGGSETDILLMGDSRSRVGIDTCHRNDIARVALGSLNSGEAADLLTRNPALPQRILLLQFLPDLRPFNPQRLGSVLDNLGSEYLNIARLVEVARKNASFGKTSSQLKSERPCEALRGYRVIDKEKLLEQLAYLVATQMGGERETAGVLGILAALEELCTISPRRIVFFAPPIYGLSQADPSVAAQIAANVETVIARIAAFGPRLPDGCWVTVLDFTSDLSLPGVEDPSNWKDPLHFDPKIGAAMLARMLAAAEAPPSR